MGLHNIDNGVVSWRCHRPKPECQPRTAQIGDLARTAPDEVALPRCPSCGEIRKLKVVYDDEEIQAPNAVEYGMVPTEMELPHAMTGEPVKVLIPALKPIGANPYIARHQELARQLEAAGKAYVESEAANGTSEQPTA